MKIRRDFVTNSSSSSFIVSFDTVPNDCQELQKILFGDMEYFATYNNSIPTIELSAVIFNDMKSNGHTNVESLMRELTNGYTELYDAPNYCDYKSYKEYEFANMVYYTDFINKNFSDLSNVFILEYGDELGGKFGSVLEDNRIFERVKCITINNH